MTVCSFIVTKKGGDQLEKEETVLKGRAGTRSWARRQLPAARKGSGWKDQALQMCPLKNFI